MYNLDFQLISKSHRIDTKRQNAKRPGKIIHLLASIIHFIKPGVVAPLHCQ
jgi:hypothetical protein